MMTIDDIAVIARTHTAESSLVPGLWLSRSAVALRSHCGSMLPVFGFATDFDAALSRRKSIFELVEHLAFHPYKPVLSNHTEVLKHSNGQWEKALDCSIDSLLLGALNFGEILHGNGCSVHTSLYQAANHAENEVLERHYCCDMWYNRIVRPRPLAIEILFNEK
ncbi:YcaO-like family protein, partial [Trinickia sp.]|uniref:YcaO-like family protein n=1 Tax=Trinickia sp. TaxID=2571163 RepID=UPI003F7FD464